MSTDGVLNQGDFIYYSFATLTTLGYSDITPVPSDLLTETVFGTLLFDIIAGLLLLGFAILPATVYPDAVRTNLLLIALKGGAMLIVGAVLYGMAARLRSYGRFLLPLPPISVGAYIYVLNKVNLPEALVGPGFSHGNGGRRGIFLHHLRSNP